MSSRTYNLFMEARRTALAAAGRLEGTETGELLPEGVTAWTWVHSRAFAGAAFQEANKEISGTRTSLGPAAHG